MLDPSRNRDHLGSIGHSEHMRCGQKKNAGPFRLLSVPRGHSLSLDTDARVVRASVRFMVRVMVKRQVPVLTFLNRNRELRYMADDQFSPL